MRPDALTPTIKNALILDPSPQIDFLNNIALFLFVLIRVETDGAQKYFCIFYKPLRFV